MGKDLADLSDLFKALDTTNEGAIKEEQFRKFLGDTVGIEHIFEHLDSNSDGEIAFSDFLAAMIPLKVEASQALAVATFRKFDIDDSGFIVIDQIGAVIGESYESLDASALLAQAMPDVDGRISFQAFTSCVFGLGGTCKDSLQNSGQSKGLEETFDTEEERWMQSPSLRDRLVIPVSRVNLRATMQGLPHPGSKEVPPDHLDERFPILLGQRSPLASLLTPASPMLANADVSHISSKERNVELPEIAIASPMWSSADASPMAHNEPCTCNLM